jgi:hypothetical protein
MVVTLHSLQSREPSDPRLPGPRWRDESASGQGRACRRGHVRCVMDYRVMRKSRTAMSMPTAFRVPTAGILPVEGSPDRPCGGRDTVRGGRREKAGPHKHAVARVPCAGEQLCLRFEEGDDGKRGRAVS